MCNFMKSRLWGLKFHEISFQLKFRLRRPTSNFACSYHTYGPGHTAYDEAATALWEQTAEVTDP